MTGRSIAAAISALLALGAAGAALASPAVWTVDKATSRLGFRSSMGGDAFEGTFRRWDAQIQFDPKALAASRVVVTVEVASAATGDAAKDQAIPTADWFDAAHFPRATFTSRAFKDLGGGRYQAQGDLVIRGVSRPLILPFTLAITGAQAKLTGQTSVNRAAFGIGKGQFASAETVPFDVTVKVSLSARQAR